MVSRAILIVLFPFLAFASPPGRYWEHTPIPDHTLRRTPAQSRYIVKFRDNISKFALNEVLTEQKPDYVYASEHFKGFASNLEVASIELLRNHQDVEFVEEDVTLTLEKTIITQYNSTWGLARLSSRTPGTKDYLYDESAGRGTCVYVLDTGVETSHPEFGGRVIWGITTVPNSTDTDGNGHGTAVAGVIGSETFGVAKKTTIIVVKVLNSNGSGTTAGVIAGMDYVISDSATRYCPNGKVAMMAVGGAKSSAINAAARAMVNAGIFLSIVAGSSFDDAANYSPGSEPLAFTVGATAQTDEMAPFSNYGEVLDMFAPGVDITTTWLGNDIATISGTTFASAHVAGLGAYILALHGNMTPDELGTYMQTIATKDVLTGVPDGTKNLLAYNGI